MIPTACISVTCPDGKLCYWRQRSFAEIKTANAFGLARDCFQPREVCPRALQRALHSMSGAAGRWEGHKASGLSDSDLADAIGYEFGEWHQGCDGGGYTAMRNGPKIWFGSQAGESGKYRKPDLQGRALVAAVREFLGIPLPVKHEGAVCEISQVEVPEVRAPWAGLPMFGGVCA